MVFNTLKKMLFHPVQSFSGSLAYRTTKHTRCISTNSAICNNYLSIYIFQSVLDAKCNQTATESLVMSDRKQFRSAIQSQVYSSGTNRTRIKVWVSWNCTHTMFSLSTLCKIIHQTEEGSESTRPWRWKNAQDIVIIVTR